MTVQTLKLGGKRFVVVEERDFRRLERLAGTTDERTLPRFFPKLIARR